MPVVLEPGTPVDEPGMPVDEPGTPVVEPPVGVVPMPPPGLVVGIPPVVEVPALVGKEQPEPTVLGGLGDLYATPWKSQLSAV